MINISATVSGNQIVAMMDTLKEKGLGKLVMILFETSLIKVAIQVISVVIMLVVYGRMLHRFQLFHLPQWETKNGDKSEQITSRDYLHLDYKGSF